MPKTNFKEGIMKTTITSVFLLVFVLMAGIGFAQKAQDDPNYGDTPEERVKTIEKVSLYAEYVKQKNYIDALPHWRYVFKNHPKCRKGVFIKGEKIIKHMMIKNRRDKKVYYAYFDTLMMVFNGRIENFGEKGNVRGRQGVAVMKYNKSKFDLAYQYLSESVKLEGEKTSAATLSTFMQTSAGMFKAGKHTSGQVVEDFGMAMDAIEPAVEKARKDAAKATDKKKEKAQVKYEKLKTARKNVEIHFVKSGAAGCKELIGFFTPKFAETPNDVNLLKKITKYLDDQGCDDSELFAKAAEQLYATEPSASSAYSLAKMFMKKEELDKSIKYYDEAITQDQKSEVPNEEFQAKCYYQKSVALYIQKKYANARTAANEAAKRNTTWGKPYILIARLYAASGSLCKNKLDSRAVYWVAVDKLQKAKSVDPEVADDAQKLINQYSKHYPNKEEAFFHNVTPGKPYKVGCWINESTKARF